MNIIVGVAQNHVIGQGLEIPWHYPKDLRWFKEQTMGGVLIMGRKTYESLPKKGLPGRELIVLSRSGVGLPNQCGNLDDAAYLAAALWPDKDVWIIGGAQIYQTARESGLVTSIYYTDIPESPPINQATVLLPPDFLKGCTLAETFTNEHDPRLTHKIYSCPQNLQQSN